MKLPIIPIEQFITNTYSLLDKQWLVLNAGDFASGQFNSMVVSWGGLGVIWNKACTMVVVRPSRYTYGFMERYPTFTLCAFPGEYRSALNLLGSRSGRDGDKIAASGLTPTALEGVDSPAYEEAELVIACRKLYWSDIDPAHFCDPALDAHYPKMDYHRQYLAEILFVRGIEAYRI